MNDLQGRNALVTGGSRGLGPLIANALAARGMNVAVTARSEADLTRVAADIAAEHDVATAAIAADLGQAEGRAHLVAQARAELGDIDVLVNNAGIEWIASCATIDPEVIEGIVRTNLIAPMLLTRLLLPGMLERGRGHVVTISSLASKKGQPYGGTYAATKAGINTWSESMRTELRGTGVSSSVVTPGFVSEVGMFAVYERRAPRIAGESSPAKVAEAVVTAIVSDRPEVLVNPGPVRLMLVANAISPSFMRWVFSKTGVHDFYREEAANNEGDKSD